MQRKLERKLNEWLQTNSNMPLMLIGARQTGKTYILKDFCTKHFAEYFYFNLELESDLAKVFDETVDPNEIIRRIEILKKISINPETSAIIFDEIQVSEKAISSLKYFSENAISYKVLTAGSLLGVKINRLQSSFPVGKVKIEYLDPLDFEEFLMAINEEKIITEIKEHFANNTAMSDVIHEKALRLFTDYLCLGGMPKIILNYIEANYNLDISAAELQQDIITAYLADMTKYTENTESIKNNKIYLSLPAQLAKVNKKFKYSIVDAQARKRDYETSLEWLLSSGMVIKAYNIIKPNSPLRLYQDEDYYKIYVNDVGLLGRLSNVQYQEIILNKNPMYRGMIIENYVATAIYRKYREMYFWSVKNTYEVDFLININGDIIPVEVKSGLNTTSKSLNYYVEKYQPIYSIRISNKNFGFENNIKSVPIYASFLI